MTYTKHFMGPDGRPVQVRIQGLDEDGQLIGDPVETEGIISFSVDPGRFGEDTTLIRGEVVARRDEEPAPLP